MMKIILADLNLQSVSAHMKHAEMHEITWSWNGKHIILIALIVELLNKKIPFYVIKIIIQKSSFVMLHWQWMWGPRFCVKYKDLIVITALHHSITCTKYFCCCKYFGHNMLQNIISVVAILDHVDINSSPGSCVDKRLLPATWQQQICLHFQSPLQMTMMWVSSHCVSRLFRSNLKDNNNLCVKVTQIISKWR